MNDPKQKPMYHPDLEGSAAYSTQAAYDVVWKIRGWVQGEDAPEEEPVVVPDAGPPGKKSETKDSSQGEVGTDG